MMRSLSERNQVRRVADLWRMTYSGSGEIYPKLKALDVRTATANDVASIIGNGSWVKAPRCIECGIETYQTIQFGDPKAYDSIDICLSCLKKAVALLTKDKS